jgi:hypothetical protein
MFHSSRSAARRAWLPIALVAAVACKQGPTPDVQARLDSLNNVAQQRERMVQELAENSRFLSEISAELAKVRAPIKKLRVSSESPLRASRDSLIQKVRYITAKVNESDAKLMESAQRIRELTTLSDSLRTTLGETVTNYQSVIAAQKATIDDLTEQINQFSADKIALVDSVNSLQEKVNTVYYVIGTRDELLQRGIIVKEGGSRFLFVFWKQGETVQPARELDPAEFHAIDKSKVVEIPLPGAEGPYRIASRQDVRGLATPPGEHGEIAGDRLKIADPEEFWKTSKFLILVQG